MTGSHEHELRQEEDRLAGRPPVVVTALTVAAVVVSCLVAWGLLALWSEGERAEIRLEPMQATPRWAAPTGPGGRRGPVAAPVRADPASEAGDDWSWVDRDAGVVRIPVEAAMEWLAEDPGAADLVRGTGSAGTGPEEDGDGPEPPGGTAARDGAGAGEPPQRRPEPEEGVEGAGPPALDGVDVEERPGAGVPLDAEFSSAAGERGPLAGFLQEGAPTLLVPGYYRCRMLCSYVLEGVAKGVAGMERPPDGGYRVVAVSIDPREEPGDAADRRGRAEAVLGADAVERSWRFLLGSRESVRRLTDAIGFRYRYDPSTDQFAHAAAAVTLTPDGAVSGYLYGMEFEPAEVSEALEAAAAGETRTTLERVLVRCFRYLPALRRHAGLIANVLRGGGALILLATGAVVVVAVRRRARAEERA